jgi:DNA-binding LacI/PurR family transcriptional regulator
VLPGDFREMAGMEACAAILAGKPRPTAVFAANDSMAIGLLAAVRAEGFAVPRDMAVVGFDNVVISRYLNPALTTVHVDACGLGRRAVDLMLENMEADKEAPCRREVLPAVLKVRQSCGASSGADGNDHEMERAGSGE